MVMVADGRSDDRDSNLSLVHVNDSPMQTSQPPAPKATPIVAFDRLELSQILGVYGRKVVAGEWRDYAMDFLRERAVFSVFARVSERPLYMIEKNPKLRNKQGQYMITNQQGRIIKRGHDLKQVLKVLEPQLHVVT
jgi:hypothetical protein